MIFRDFHFLLIICITQRNDNISKLHTINRTKNPHHSSYPSPYILPFLSHPPQLSQHEIILSY